jgi:hypothetical protein
MTAWLPEALVGPRLVVRATGPGDLPVLAALALDPAVRAHLGGPRTPAAFGQWKVSGSAMIGSGDPTRGRGPSCAASPGDKKAAHPGEPLIAAPQEADIRLLERAGAEQYGLPQRQYEFRR